MTPGTERALRRLRRLAHAEIACELGIIVWLLCGQLAARALGIAPSHRVPLTVFLALWVLCFALQVLQVAVLRHWYIGALWPQWAQDPFFMYSRSFWDRVLGLSPGLASLWVAKVWLAAAVLVALAWAMATWRW